MTVLDRVFDDVVQTGPKVSLGANFAVGEFVPDLSLRSGVAAIGVQGGATVNFTDGSAEAGQCDVRQLDQQVIVIRQNNPSAALAVGFGKCLEQAALQGGQFIGFSEVMLVLVACGGEEVPSAAIIWMGGLCRGNPRLTRCATTLTCCSVVSRR